MTSKHRRIRYMCLPLDHSLWTRPCSYQTLRIIITCGRAEVRAFGSLRVRACYNTKTDGYYRLRCCCREVSDSQKLRQRSVRLQTNVCPRRCLCLRTNNGLCVSIRAALRLPTVLPHGIRTVPLCNKVTMS